MSKTELRFRQVYLDFHTSEMIEGILILTSMNSVLFVLKVHLKVLSSFKGTLYEAKLVER